MNHEKCRLFKIRMFSSIALMIILSLLGSALSVMKIQAQSSNSWSDPVNLSQSGSANGPALVVDSGGTFHTTWSDEFAGNKYVFGDGAEWSQPLIVDLPFANAVPKLMADQDGFIHAFWLESDNVLFYSAVRSTDFDSVSSWIPPVQLAEAALNFDITLDEQGNIHLIYLRPVDSTEFPAGIYYRKLVKEVAGWVWSSPILLYSSPYFRSLELDDPGVDIEANTALEESSVDIATSSMDGAIHVYGVWDNRPLERVYLAISNDGGQTWGLPNEIDKPDNALGYNSTRNILVEAFDQDVLLVWQRDNTGIYCSHYSQKSNDGGDTWDEPGEISTGSSICSLEHQLLNDGNGLIYLWTIPQNQVKLFAWDGQQWSSPQIQNELSSFRDPETQKTVTYDCRNPVLDGSQRLTVIGCDTGEGGDVWFMYRVLDDVGNWFSAQSDWSETEEIVNSQIPFDAPILLATPDDHFLALWSQVDETSNNRAIYLARWDGESWSPGEPILQSSQRSVAQPSAAIDGEGRVLVVWSESPDGKLYFSWANVANAQNPAEWSEPVALPISQTLASSPRLSVNKTGKIDIEFTVPVNEGRGIYLIQSEDGGETWSSPVRIFDAAAASWQMVDSPQFVEIPDGGLHTLWSQRSFLDVEGRLGLYYARSEDDGNTWSEAETVTDQEVAWSQIATLDQGSLVRIWQEGNLLQPVIKYQFSQDSGLNWSEVESLGSFGEKSLMANLITDPAGNLHMLQIVQASSGNLAMRDWLREEERWTVSEYFDLGGESLEDAASIESAISTNGILALILSAQTRSQSGNSNLYGLFFTNRTLDLPVVESPEPTTTPADSLVPSPTSTSVISISTNTPEVQSTPPPIPSTDASSGPPASSNNSFTGAGLGVLLSALVIGVAVILGIWRVRSNR